MTSMTLKRMSRIASQWGITVSANVGSVYLLDAIASAFGISFVAFLELVAPSVLDAPMTYIILFLIATYAAWGYSLSKNLKANIDLLETTGTSTNMLSKVLYDIAGATKPKIRKLAANTGYVAIELAKEIPYYVLAFGAAAASQDVTVKMSILFLAGANIGAAVYEYVLAVSTIFILPFLKK